jgi:membrane-bound lytic murein transglycosylase F
LLEQIKQKGELIVLTRNSATTYYEGKDGMTGFEYDLVKMFADELGVKAKFIVPKQFSDTLPMLINSEAHLAAAGLTITPNRKTMVRFCTPYQTITQQLIYKMGNKKPRKLDETIGTLFEVVAGSSHEEELLRHKQKNPKLDWIANSELGSEELINLVWEGVLDYTIADSNEVSVNKRYYPELKVAFNLTKPEELAWAFPHAEDSSLYDAAREFFHRIKQTGELDRLMERYYGKTKNIGFVGTNTFKFHAELRLPKYIGYFKAAAKDNDFDWKLLAAMAYQESHWDPDATSPTGVRGLMMLTNNTARYVNIDNREDPEQSITGGARYLRILKQKLPKRIKGKDRLLLSLAAYNVGLGHLEDARILTQRHGGNRDKWDDIQKYLPLLSQEKYHKNTKHGYARGREPVTYVENIRTYYNLLVWLNQQKSRKNGEKQQPPPLSPSSSSVL